MSNATLVRSTSTAEARTLAMADALSAPDGGYSKYVANGRDVVAGYLVSPYPEREHQIAGKVSAAEVRAYLSLNQDAVRIPGAVFGGWRNPADGVAYLDVSVVVSTRAEAEAVARRFGQLAYYDVAAGRSVDMTGAGVAA